MNDKPLWWVSPSNQLYKSRMEAVTNGEQMITPLYDHPAKTLTVSKDDVENLVCSGEYWTLDDHLNIVSVHFDEFADAILRKA